MNESTAAANSDPVARLRTTADAYVAGQLPLQEVLTVLAWWRQEATRRMAQPVASLEWARLRRLLDHTMRQLAA